MPGMSWLNLTGSCDGSFPYLKIVLARKRCQERMALELSVSHFAICLLYTAHALFIRSYSV